MQLQGHRFQTEDSAGRRRLRHSLLPIRAAETRNVHLIVQARLRWNKLTL
jgi:hypothetical protein